MKAGSILRAALCALALLACAGCAELQSLFGPSTLDPATQMPALETRIYALVQDERGKLGHKALTLALDPELTNIARQRSAAMAKSDSFSGSGDPHASATMLMQQDAKFQGLVGENVAAQHFRATGGGIDVDAFARRFVDSWLASKPHAENLSFPDYDRTGVGAAVNGDTVYVTQLFSSNLGLGPQSAAAPSPQVEQVATPQKGKDDSEKVPLRGTIAPGAPSH